MVIGAGVAGLYQLHLLRAQGLRVRAYDAAEDVGRLVVVARLPGLAPRLRGARVPVPVLRGALPRLGLERALPRRLRGAAMAALRRRPARPASRHPPRHPDRRPAPRRGARPLDRAHRPRRDPRRPVRRRLHGAAAGADDRPDRRRLRGAGPRHRALAGGPVRPRRAAGRRPRERRGGGPARADDRRPGVAADGVRDRSRRPPAPREPGVRLAGAGRLPAPVRRAPRHGRPHPDRRRRARTDAR